MFIEALFRIFKKMKTTQISLTGEWINTQF